MHFDPSYMVQRRSPTAHWPHLVDANAYSVIGQVPIGQAAIALTANRLYICPFFCPLPIALTSIGIVCTVLDAGATETVTGLFNWDQENKEVRELHTSFATALDTSSTGATGLITNSTDFPLVLEPGWYAWGLVSDGTPTLQFLQVYDPMIQGNVDISGTDFTQVSYYYATGTGMVAGGITDPGDYSDLTEATAWQVRTPIVARFNLNPAVPA